MPTYDKFECNTERGSQRRAYRRSRDPLTLGLEREKVRDKRNKDKQRIEDIEDDDGLEERISENMFRKIKG